MIAAYVPQHLVGVAPLPEILRRISGVDEEVDERLDAPEPPEPSLRLQKIIGEAIKVRCREIQARRREYLPGFFAD